MNDEYESVATHKRCVAKEPKSETGRQRRLLNGIRPGDTIDVYKGFTYVKGGGRDYFCREALVRKGPAWSDLEREHFALQWRANFSSVSVKELDEFESRTGLKICGSDMIRARAKAAEETRRYHAERRAAFDARPGDEIFLDGKKYVRGYDSFKLVMHSNAANENGDAVDCSVVRQCTLSAVDSDDLVTLYSY